jgi:hypothetical protein
LPQDLELAVLAVHDIAQSRQNSLLLLVVLDSDFDTPLWVYFVGFYGRYGGIRTQEEADESTEAGRAWLAARPGSIAAFLCLSNAQIGQID